MPYIGIRLSADLSAPASWASPLHSSDERLRPSNVMSKDTADHAHFRAPDTAGLCDHGRPSAPDPEPTKTYSPVTLGVMRLDALLNSVGIDDDTDFRTDAASRAADTKARIAASSAEIARFAKESRSSDCKSQLDEIRLAQLRETKLKYSFTDFCFDRTLGTGSFGRVHLAQAKHNRHFYAIKVLKKHKMVHMKQIEHTNNERDILSIVHHPFVVTLWDTFQDTKNLYMVMDFVEGGELFSLLRKSKFFPDSVAKFYAAEVALAIDYLHSLDIIYRDLKPENLLLDWKGHLKITDFGFAKRCSDRTWTLCGTPEYLAPEVVASKGYNKSVDWWNLGILIFEMLAGHPPFYDPNPLKLYESILACSLTLPSHFDPHVQDLLSHLITTDLTQRYGNLARGSQDIFGHSWFLNIPWQRLLAKEISAPYIPPVRGFGDASLFETYPEDYEFYDDTTGSDLYKDYFSNF